MVQSLRPDVAILDDAGYGDPLDRDPQAVLDDVLDELVSLAAAERDYGVVLVGEPFEGELRVDEGATLRLRQRRRTGKGG